MGINVTGRVDIDINAAFSELLEDVNYVVDCMAQEAEARLDQMVEAGERRQKWRMLLFRFRLASLGIHPGYRSYEGQR